jgi:hypothetical protein
LNKAGDDKRIKAFVLFVDSETLFFISQETFQRICGLQRTFAFIADTARSD